MRRESGVAGSREVGGLGLEGLYLDLVWNCLELL